MPVNVAIVGPAGAGKTTLFNALTAGRGADGVGMVDIPDERLTRLADAVKPAKVTAAQVRVEDTPPGSRAQRVAFARQADVLVKVARCFGPDPDPAAELEEFALDLVLADLASVERRLEIVAQAARAGKKDAESEHDVLTIAQPGRGRIARADGDAGVAIACTTARDPRLRAWPREQDAPAPGAAGNVHTDLRTHLIRAELTSVDELVAAGSMDAVRAAGKLR